MEAELLQPLVDYFYTGSINIDDDNVMSLLEAASLLLLPKLVQACGKYLASRLEVDNCLKIHAVATSRDFGTDLDWLRGRIERFIQLHFEEVWKTPEFIGCENIDDEAEVEDEPAIEVNQLARLLQADDLCVDSEESVFYCVDRYLKSLGR